MFLRENVCCDLSLEPSHRDGSNEGSQHTFLLRNRKIIFELSSVELCNAQMQTWTKLVFCLI